MHRVSEGGCGGRATQAVLQIVEARGSVWPCRCLDAASVQCLQIFGPLPHRCVAGCRMGQSGVVRRLDRRRAVLQRAKDTDSDTRRCPVGFGVFLFYVRRSCPSRGSSEVFAPAALTSVREKQAGRTRLVWSANGEPSFPREARSSVFASRRNLRCRCFWTEVKIRVWAGAAGSKRQALLAFGLVAGALLDEKNPRCRESHLDNSRAGFESD